MAKGIISEVTVTSNFAAFAEELKQFRQRDVNRIIRRATEYALTDVVQEIRSLAPARMRLKKGTTFRVRTGLLRKSIGKVVRTYPDKFITVGRVGSIRSVYGPEPGNNPKRKRVRRVPAIYVHLIEKGFIHRRGSTNTVVPGTHFIERGYNRTKRAVQQRYLWHMRKSIDALVAKCKTKYVTKKVS